jgi:hypothetical protein
VISIPLRIRTATDGTATVKTSAHPGLLIGVNVIKGTLSTPDITITDEPLGTVLLDVDGLATDAQYRLVAAAQGDDGANVVGAYAPPVVLGRIQVAVSGAGSKKEGQVTLLVDR